MLFSISTSYSCRIREGSKGRLVIWVLRDINDEWSSLLIQQLPFYIVKKNNQDNSHLYKANLCFWKKGGVPLVIRLKTSFLLIYFQLFNFYDRKMNKKKIINFYQHSNFNILKLLHLKKEKKYMQVEKNPFFYYRRFLV